MLYNLHNVFIVRRHDSNRACEHCGQCVTIYQAVVLQDYRIHLQLAHRVSYQLQRVRIQLEFFYRQIICIFFLQFSFEKGFQIFLKNEGLYIQLGQCNRRLIMAFFQAPRSVHCILCRGAAELRQTKTIRLMLRCDNCRLLLFANGMVSQQILRNLPNYQQPYRRFY